MHLSQKNFNGIMNGLMSAELVHQNEATDNDDPVLWSHVDESVGTTEGLSGGHVPRKARGSFSESSRPTGPQMFYTRKPNPAINDEKLKAELEAKDIDSDMETNGEDNDGSARTNEIDPRVSARH